MPDQYRFVATITTVSGVTADYITNTWHFSGPTSPTTTEFSAACAELQACWYGTGTFSKYLSPLMNAGPFSTIKVYKQSDPKPQRPVFQTTISCQAVNDTGNPMPTEVALVLSIAASTLSGVNMRRRRNRVYLGPLATSILGTDGRPSTACMTDMFNRQTRFKNFATAAAGWTPNVYSPTDNIGLVIDHTWVDNEWDTQRRRGRKSTARQTVTW